jgi:hypothetical protein
MNWKSLFLESLEKRSVNGMVQALELQTTTHAGTAPSKIKQQAIKLIRSAKLDDLFSMVS